MRIRYAELIAPREFVVREGQLDTSDNEVMIEIAACGLCMWELKNHYLGKLGSFPQRVGHEPAGVIVEAGKSVRGWNEGDRVTGLLPGVVDPQAALEGFATHVAADPRWLVKVPDNVEIGYALGEPLKCVVTVAKAANPQRGDYILVVGCGSMGLLILATLKRNSPAEIIALGHHPERLRLAKEIGATITLNPRECNVEKEIQRITKGHGVDVAIEAAGGPEALQIAGKILRSRRGKLVVAGYHGSPTACDMNTWCRRGIEIHVAHPNYSLDEMEDMNRAMDALAKGIFPMDKIITHRFALNEIQAAFEAALSKPQGYIKGIVVP